MGRLSLLGVMLDTGYWILGSAGARCNGGWMGRLSLLGVMLDTGYWVLGSAGARCNGGWNERDTGSGVSLVTTAVHTKSKAPETDITATPTLPSIQYPVSSITLSSNGRHSNDRPLTYYSLLIPNFTQTIIE